MFSWGFGVFIILLSKLHDGLIPKKRLLFKNWNYLQLLVEKFTIDSLITPRKQQILIFKKIMLTWYLVPSGVAKELCNVMLVVVSQHCILSIIKLNRWMLMWIVSVHEPHNNEQKWSFDEQSHIRIITLKKL